MEWAKEGEGVDVESLRERVGRDLAGKEDGERRTRRRLDLAGDKEEMDGLEG